MTKPEITALMLALKKLIQKGDIDGVEEIIDIILEDANSSASKKE